MTFIHDTRDKIGKHNNVDEYLIANGHKIVRSKLYVGDISLLNDQSVCIDLKRNLQELVSNVCQQHKRFTDELKRAQEYGIKLIILCEHGGQIKSMGDVIKWDNPRLKASPLAMSGERLCKVLCTLAGRYGVQFEFCDKRVTGRRITELLGGEQYDGKTAENG